MSANGNATNQPTGATERELAAPAGYAADDDKIRWPAMRLEIRHMISQWTARKHQLCAAEQMMLENDINILRDIV